MPEFLKEKVLARLKTSAWNRYPIPYATGLSEKIAQREGWVTEGVVVSGGSNVLIQAIVVAAAVKGKVLTIAPSFSLYELQGKMLGNKVIEVPLNSKDFSLPTEKILKVIKKEKPHVIFLPNPNAPTGNLFPEKDLLAIIKAATGLVVIDEAYYPFSGYTFASVLKKYKNLILLRTFSKAFSLGGVRLGYLMAHPAIAQEIQKVVLPFSVGILSQVLGEIVLEEADYVDRVVKESIRERDSLYQSLLKIKGIKVYPSLTNFILFQVSRPHYKNSKRPGGSGDCDTGCEL
ncbi:MAG: aminotransferase class I/II-fold pyridoxal phosphate-dependent enzyme [Deltaproteobacteria bacterium]|nr:MAG: aminotransferase class I/II-fold pyridoxal phosphate-dependent enzyme [Deltaproteobacteria bacterium]